jgi:hypothetical protein
MKDLHDVRRALLAHVGDDGKFSLVNARLILRTGINLSSFRHGQEGNPAVVARAVAALADMGFALDGGGKGKW